MASVFYILDRPLRRKTLDARKWRGFALAYLDENGEPGYAVYANTLSEAKELLREALERLNVQAIVDC